MNKPKNADELIVEVIKYAEDHIAFVKQALKYTTGDKERMYGSLATMQGVLEMFNIYKGNMNSAQNIEDTKNATSK